LIKKETEELNNKLNQAKKEKDFKNTCEEIGKVINSYSPHTELNNKINSIENDNRKIIASQNAIMNKIGMESKKLSLLLKIVNDLKTNLSNLKTSQDELMEF
jgi:septation ring formation regulator EzrA